MSSEEVESRAIPRAEDCSLLVPLTPNPTSGTVSACLLLRGIAMAVQYFWNRGHPKVTVFTWLKKRQEGEE